jgi:type III restriction enzyme
VAESEPLLSFDNGIELRANEPYEMSSAAGQRVVEQAAFKPETRHRVFNVIDRAQRETRLTRSTLNRIFRDLSVVAQRKLFANPEGWAGEFVHHVREVVADLVSESLSFAMEGTDRVDLEELFPPTKRFTQKELLEAGKTGLYDFVQRDSDVEERFVTKLRADRNVELYFKFPPAFKVNLPRIVGNYNPDWGIVRRDEHGSVTLHLVRETKGSEDVRKLQFPHERRKIACALKYFGTAGVDYRVITDKTPEWWASEASIDKQIELLEP